MLSDGRMTPTEWDERIEGLYWDHKLSMTQHTDRDKSLYNLCRFLSKLFGDGLFDVEEYDLQEEEWDCDCDEGDCDEDEEE